MDFKEVQSIIKNFEKSNLTSLDLEIEGLKLKLSKNGVQTINNTPVVSPIEEKITKAIVEKNEPVTQGFEVKSPLVGTYYAANSPKDKPFVTVGQKVEQGQTLCIIEAMKIMNEITAPVSGVIESISVKNGAAIGFDQVLMVIA